MACMKCSHWWRSSDNRISWNRYWSVWMNHETDTRTLTDKMGTVPSGDQYWYQCRCNANTSTLYHRVATKICVLTQCRCRSVCTHYKWSALLKTQNFIAPTLNNIYMSRHVVSTAPLAGSHWIWPLIHLVLHASGPDWPLEFNDPVS